MQRTLIIFLFFTACATGEKFRPGGPLSADQSRLYIYRPGFFRGSLGRPVIRISGKEYATLTNGGYAEIRIQPGHHLVEIVRSDNVIIGTFTSDLEKLRDYYLKFTVDRAICKSALTCLRVIDKESALEEINETRSIYP